MLSIPVRMGDIIGPKAAVADGAVMAWDGTSGYVAKSATAIDGLPIGQTTPSDGTFLTLTGKRLVVPEKDALADPANVIGSTTEHDSSGISQLDIFSDETFSYSHNLRLIHSGTTGQNNAWCHMYGPKGTLTSNEVHMWACDYVGASQIGQLKLLERGGAQKMIWNWGSDANTYFHFGAGSRIGTSKLSVNGDVSFSGTMTVTLAENAVWLGNASNQNTTLATGEKGRALIGLADDAALTTEILARVTGSTIVGTKLEATSTADDSIKTVGGITSAGCVFSDIFAIRRSVNDSNLLIQGGNDTTAGSRGGHIVLQGASHPSLPNGIVHRASVHQFQDKDANDWFKIESGTPAAQSAANAAVGNGTVRAGTKIECDGTAADAISSAGGVTLAGDIIGAATTNLYFGPSDTDGSWRMVRSGNNLVFQRRESGTWTTKSTISA